MKQIILATLILAMMIPATLSPVASAQESTDQWIRVSLIEASKSSEFQVDKKLQSLENQLKKLRSDKEKMQEILQNFRKFTPLWIAKPQPFTLEKPLRIPLDEKETVLLDMTLNPPDGDFYPASIRWFFFEGKEDKDILKIKSLKINKKRCLFLFDLGEISEESASFKILAIEFVDPKEAVGASKDS